ncbi:hypothetical protein SGRIM128S_01590 [Streptomyces griseomycini]
MEAPERRQPVQAAASWPDSLRGRPSQWKMPGIILYVEPVAEAAEHEQRHEDGTKSGSDLPCWRRRGAVAAAGRDDVPRQVSQDALPVGHAAAATRAEQRPNARTSLRAASPSRAPAPAGRTPAPPTGRAGESDRRPGRPRCAPSEQGGEQDEPEVRADVPEGHRQSRSPSRSPSEPCTPGRPSRVRRVAQREDPVREVEPPPAGVPLLVRAPAPSSMPVTPTAPSSHSGGSRRRMRPPTTSTAGAAAGNGP